MTILSANASFGKEWDKLKSPPAWDFMSEIQVREVLHQGISYLFVSLTDICHIKHSEHSKHLQTWKGRVLLRGTTSKTKVDSEQLSRSKELQLRNWRRQDSCIQVPDTQAWVRPTTRYKLLRRCICRKHHDCCDYQSATGVDKTSSRRSQHWDAIEDFVVPVERHLYGRRSSSQKQEKVPTWEYRHEKQEHVATEIGLEDPTFG